MALLLFLSIAGLLIAQSPPDGRAIMSSTAWLQLSTPASGDEVSVSGCAAPKRGSVHEALSELFTCLVKTRVEKSVAHRVAAERINFGRLAGSGALQGPLLSGLYSTRQLTAQHESYRLFYEMERLFPAELGQNETRGPGESAKIDAYLSHLERSAYIVDTYRTLKSNGALPNSSSTTGGLCTLTEFVRVVMFDHWFKQYARQAKLHKRHLMESSGFGHVFVGEFSNRGVTGFHNWLSILAAEERGTFQYKGFMKVTTDPLVLGSIQFGWHGRQKPISSFVFGVEPEFQLALFSACFVVNPGRKTRLRIKSKSIGVQTYVVNHQPESVASAYIVL